MARMASRPRIGIIIREAMEREHMDQIQLAAALDVSRSAVNAWINDRAWPLNRIAALEELLKIKIPRTLEEQRVLDGAAAPPPVPPAPPPPGTRERELWDLLTAESAPEDDRLSPAEAWKVIQQYRRGRRVKPHRAVTV